MQERLEWPKDKKGSNGKEKQFGWTPWRRPFPLRHVMVIGYRNFPFEKRKVPQRVRPCVHPTITPPLPGRSLAIFQYLPFYGSRPATETASPCHTDGQPLWAVGREQW